MKSDTAKSGKRRVGTNLPVPKIETIIVSRNLNIYEAQSLKDELLDLPARATAIELNLSQVIEIDTSGIQLLLLAQRESGKQGKTLRLAICSPAVQEIIELYNLADLLCVGLARPVLDSAPV